MKNLLKKLWIACFTHNPYRVKPFTDLYPGAVGEAIDQPETLTAVLTHEQGETIYYPPLLNTLMPQINYRYLGDKQRFVHPGIFKAPNRYVYSISNAHVLGQLGLVYDAVKRSFIDEAAKEWSISLTASPYVNALNLPLKTPLKGITISFLTIGADGGFYHFLFESIVKTGMFGYLLNQADHFLFNGPPVDWKLKWLTKANIDTAKIIWMDGSSHYECEQLIFTNRLINDQQINKWCVNTLLNLFGINRATIATTEQKIIWISRKGLVNREIMWEDEILTIFPAIEIVDFSQLSVDDTINKLRQASHVIGAHGAGLSNLYLCSPGTKVLELYPQGVFFQPCYHRLSSVCGLYHAVLYLDFINKENTIAGLSYFAEALTKFIC